MTEELKPCPDGHTSVHLWKSVRAYDGAPQFDVVCSGQDCEWALWGLSTAETAVCQWNARSVEDALRARVAELEAKAAIADSVPWEAINSAFGNFFGEAWADEGSPVDVIEKWLDAHAPKESTHV